MSSSTESSDLPQHDTFKTRTTLSRCGREYTIYSMRALADAGFAAVRTLPYSLKVLLENLLRREDGRTVTRGHLEALIDWDPKAAPDTEIAFMPARVILQDFTGVPAVVDLAAMRDATVEAGADAARINPQVPVDLIIDHSVQVDQFGNPDAFQANVAREYERNRERYEFLRWGATAFEGFRVVPPGTGIVHQINLEYLASAVFTRKDGDTHLAYPDTLVGTDSHTTMINGLGVLGWGVGGIEAEAAMLGQPVSMLIPHVVGFRLVGELPQAATATDLVLAVTQRLREVGVVGKFVEFHGPGLKALTLADRATIANMAPEYGATMGFFPIDEKTLEYLRFTGREESEVDLVEAYARHNLLFASDDQPEPRYTEVVELDMSTVEISLAGPRRPQDRIPISQAKVGFQKTLRELNNPDMVAEGGTATEVAVETEVGTVTHGSVVIAAITSCTNTSNPSVMLAAGLVARKAAEKGLTRKGWVKTSLAPGSRVVTRYLEEAGLLDDLAKVGFELVGYGCTTCIGNSGPLIPAVSEAVREADLTVCSVLSGNRNFEGRVNPQVKANYLASPPLVVAYAIAGSMDIDITKDPLGVDQDGQAVYLDDLWPTSDEIQQAILGAVKPEQFRAEYATVFEGDPVWQELPVPEGRRFDWQASSTYVKRPAFLTDVPREPEVVTDIEGARVLALLGDSVTTDHISPAGAIPLESPAGQWLRQQGVAQRDFNSFGSRRGNHEVMVRGTFGNIRLQNLLAPGTRGGVTVHQPSGEQTSIYEAAMKYAAENVPAIVIAGTDYGMGSSRDWAAKGTKMLGVRAVLATSYERIHRSNLIGMGVLPLQFQAGEGAVDHGIDGTERFDIHGIAEGLEPGSVLSVTATRDDGTSHDFSVVCRIDTPDEMEYFQHGGILDYVLRSLWKA